MPHGVELDELIAALRAAGARFAFAFGSRVPGTGLTAPARPDSDLDVAAWGG